MDSHWRTSLVAFLLINKVWTIWKNQNEQGVHLKYHTTNKFDNIKLNDDWQADRSLIISVQLFTHWNAKVLPLISLAFWKMACLVGGLLMSRNWCGVLMKLICCKRTKLTVNIYPKLTKERIKATIGQDCSPDMLNVLCDRTITFWSTGCINH